MSSSGSIINEIELNFRGVNFSPRDFWSTSNINAADFVRIKSWGIDHIRFRVQWHSIEPDRDQPGYYRENMLEQVDTYIDWANDAGLDVVLGLSKGNDGGDSWIQWEEFFYDPDIRERFYNLWDMMLARYKDRSNIFAWDPLAVPNHASTDWDARADIWKNIMTPIIIDKIRSVDDSRWILWQPVRFQASDLRLVDDSKVIYCANFYYPFSVTHRGEEYTYTKEQLQAHSEWQAFLRFKNDNKVPIYIGEFGINIDSYGGDPPSASRLLWVEHVAQLAIEDGLSWAYWVFGKGRWQFDLLNSDGTERAVVEILKNNI